MSEIFGSQLTENAGLSYYNIRNIDIIKKELERLAK